MIQFKRDGKSVWPTCTACGCRLHIMAGNDDATLVHFGYGLSDYDARGCKCAAISMIGFAYLNQVEEFVDA